ncbi:ROK family protein [Arachidicoccus terrestris]|uniref:ROK family protein n=1 Tax=Arachidicoccus terrestris TaxID=2875539 RepID=UPI001CC44988|nr:ROK family protein [Arachidicoccus terrestris]UAY56091.1 ROK family protein [Arachidicoccus terrestris]
MKDHVVGIDIGGSHITAALVAMDVREVVSTSMVREKVDRFGTAEAILNAWAGAVKRCLEKGGVFDPDTRISDAYGQLNIGIAMPGPFDYEKGISRIKGFDKYDSLYGLNIKALLADRIGINPDSIRLKNDAACFLDGELFAGAAKDAGEVLGITLGTGFGTAFGRCGIATDAALSAEAFLDGRAEDYFSTRWFIETAKAVGDIDINGVMDLRQPGREKIAKMIFDMFAGNLALFFQCYLQKYTAPDLVVIGGNIAQAHVYFLEPLIAKLKEMQIELNFKVAALGESAALLGAASLWQKKPA